MNITISRSELKTAITGLGRIIPSKPCLPVLGAVRLAVQDGTLTATATDLDQIASYRYQNATVEGTGTMILPITALKELTKGSDRENIMFRTDGQQVLVTNHVGGHSIQFTLNSMDPAEWPEGPKTVVTKPAEGFLETYRRLLPFASSDETRFAINHVYIDVEGKSDHPVCMVSTDGRRLSVWNSMSFDLRSSVPVPASRFLAWTGLTGKVAIGLKEDVTPKRGKEPEDRKAWFGVEVGSWTYLTRVPEVNFPNWRQVIPAYDAQTQQCCFGDQDVEALRKILPRFPGHDNGNCIVLSGQSGRLAIAGRAKDAREETLLVLENSSHSGSGGRIGMNRQYLLDALAAGFRRFSYVDQMSPLKAEDQRGGTHVLMPVRIEEPAASEAAVTTVSAQEGHETNKENRMTENKEELNAMDKVLLALETARGKLRDAASSLSEVTDAVKVAVRENKGQTADLEKARATLLKLQAISL